MIDFEGNEDENHESIDHDDHEVIQSRPKKSKKSKKRAPIIDDDLNSFDEDLAPLYELEDEKKDEQDVLRQLGATPIHCDYVVLPKPKGQRNFKAVSPSSHEMASLDVLSRLVINNGILSASFSFYISDHLGQDLVKILPNITPEVAADMDKKLQANLEAFKNKTKAGKKTVYQETRRLT